MPPPQQPSAPEPVQTAVPVAQPTVPPVLTSFKTIHEDPEFRIGVPDGWKLLYRDQNLGSALASTLIGKASYRDGAANGAARCMLTVRRFEGYASSLDSAFQQSRTRLSEGGYSVGETISLTNSNLWAVKYSGKGAKGMLLVGYSGRYSYEVDLQYVTELLSDDLALKVIQSFTL
jgi:hypothetical protein